MAFPGRTLSHVIITLIQVVCVSCQCDNSPVAVHVPHFHTKDIRSPGYPAIYGRNLDCSWKISSEYATDIFFVRIENVYVDCIGDKLRLTKLKTNTNLVTFCGDATTSDLYIQPGGLMAEFSTNGVQRPNDKGFRIRVTNIPYLRSDVDVCTGQREIMLEAEKKTKVLTSPAFPNNYPSNLNCKWKIPSKPGYGIQINIEVYDIEYGTMPPQDPVDYLQIREITNISTPLKKYSGRWNFESVELVYSGSVELTFKSDSDTTYGGFLLRFKLVGSGLGPSAADTASTTEESVSVSENIPTTDDNTLPASQEAMSTTKDAWTTEYTLAPSQESMSTTEDAWTTQYTLAPSQESMSTTEDAWTTEYTLSPSQESMSSKEDTMTTMSIMEFDFLNSKDILSISRTILSSSEEIYTKEDKLSTKEDLASTLDMVSRTKTTTQEASDTEPFHTASSLITVTSRSDITDRQTSVVTRTFTSDGRTDGVSSGISKVTTLRGPTEKDTINLINIRESTPYRNIQQNSSSCGVYKCVIPVVIAIGLFLSVLFLVSVILGARHFRRRKYRMRDAKVSCPLVTLSKTTN